MKNHYISQFIIRRFSDAINIFDIETGKIDESKRPHKVFYKNDIYDDEIEKLINFNIESKVANILDKKIMNSNVIRLTRMDLLILKKYMLISSVRTIDELHFYKLLKNFTPNADKYISLHVEYKNLKSINNLSINEHELYLRTLKVFATSANIRDIANNPLATREMLAWALPFLESYLAFWDCPKDKEFVLTDSGMCTEYEGFHLLTGGLDISKTSYLFHKILKEDKAEYGAILSSTFTMYENYNIFNLSSNRCMIMINPFFRLYQNQRIELLENNSAQVRAFDIPDIWPAIIQDKNLFEVPQNEYVFSEKHLCNDDIFIYKPKDLTNEDFIYINAILLSQAKEIIGFNDPKKIIDSIYYHVWYKANFESVTSLDESDEQIACKLVENVVNSPYRCLCDYCDCNGGINKTEFIFLFEKLISNIYKDFNENPYICEYYLNHPQQAENCKNLAFLRRSGLSIVNFFKKHLSEIQRKKIRRKQCLNI